MPLLPRFLCSLNLYNLFPSLQSKGSLDRASEFIQPSVNVMNKAVRLLELDTEGKLVLSISIHQQQLLNLTRVSPEELSQHLVECRPESVHFLNALHKTHWPNAFNP